MKLFQKIQKRKAIRRQIEKIVLEQVMLVIISRFSRDKENIDSGVKDYEILRKKRSELEQQLKTI